MLIAQLQVMHSFPVFVPFAQRITIFGQNCLHFRARYPRKGCIHFIQLNTNYLLHTMLGFCYRELHDKSLAQSDRSTSSSFILQCLIRPNCFKFRLTKDTKKADNRTRAHPKNSKLRTKHFRRRFHISASQHRFISTTIM